LKRVGSLVYWLLKFKPFTILDGRIVNGVKNLEAAFMFNESFAASLVYSGLMNFGNLKKVPKKDSETHKAFLYAFKYREMSQDSIMTLIYSLSII
jgi:hypothetical protein